MGQMSNVQRPHIHLQLSKVHVFPENVSPGHLHTGEASRADFAVSSCGAPVQLEEKNCFSCLPKYEEVQEPVGGRAVDVDHVADVAFTISCLLPETHGKLKLC